MDRKLVEIFVEKLYVDGLTEDEQLDFVYSVTKYLQHNRDDSMKGRTYEYIYNKLDLFIEICSAIGLEDREMVRVITLFPSILNIIDSFYEKYLLLGVVENEDNTLRRNKLVNKPRDFVIGLKQIYARYKLMSDLGYGKMTWNTLVHASKMEFASIFVVKDYYKSYRVFEKVEQVMRWLDEVEVADLDIERFKELNVNKEIVLRYEKNGKGYR